MNTVYVREFICLAEIKNYLEAADTLYISQSTLSRHIQSLEDSLGIPLFIRTTRSVILSDFGETFLPYAKKIINAEDDGIQAILEKKHTQDILSIGSVPVMTQYDISGFLAQFQKAHPNFILHITENSLPILKNQLTAGKYDFIFAQEKKIKHDEFIRIPYATDYLVIVFPITHPLASSKSVSIDQLKQESFLLLPETTLVHNQFMKLCSHAKITPHISVVIKNGDTAVGMVSKGMGITVLMKQTAHYLCRENTAIVNLEPRIHSYINILYSKHKPLSDAASCFLHYAKYLE